METVSKETVIMMPLIEVNPLAWISSPIAQRNVKHWATQIGAGCLPLFHLMDAKLQITAAICMYLAWTLFQTLKCLKHQKPSRGQNGPSPPSAKRRPFTTLWRGRSWMDCCLIHERLTNHHIWHGKGYASHFYRTYLKQHDLHKSRPTKSINFQLHYLGHPVLCNWRICVLLETSWPTIGPNCSQQAWEMSWNV